MDPNDPAWLYNTEGLSMTGNNENALALYRIIDRESVLLGIASAPAVTLTGGGTPANRTLHGITGISLTAGASIGDNLDGATFPASALNVTGSETSATFTLTIGGNSFTSAVKDLTIPGALDGGVELTDMWGNTVTLNLNGAYNVGTANFNDLQADLNSVTGEFHGGADAYDTDPSTVAFETESINNLVKYMSGMILDIAETLKNGKDIMNTQSILTVDVANQRISISGVSLDEEMTNLIMYQHAYDGAARVLTTMDEALETLINKMGIVGR
jgi:flagellar hook-associated protein FlgK